MNRNETKRVWKFGALQGWKTVSEAQTVREEIGQGFEWQMSRITSQKDKVIRGKDQIESESFKVVLIKLRENCEGKNKE